MVYNNQNYQSQVYTNGQLQGIQGMQGAQNVQNVQSMQSAQGIQNMQGVQNMPQFNPLGYQANSGYGQSTQMNNMYNNNPYSAIQANSNVSQLNYNQSGNQYSGYNATQQNTKHNNQVWVQGEAGAKAYPVAIGDSVMLMDSENNVFYIKSMGDNGVPLPLRTFDYTERIQQAQQNNIVGDDGEGVVRHELNKNDDYVTRDEFEKLEKRITELINSNKLNYNGRKDRKNESTVQSSKRTEQSTE